MGSTKFDWGQSPTPGGIPWASISNADRGHDGQRYIQFDNEINLGNSGGPLFDSNGHVVGMVAKKVLSFTRSDNNSKESVNGIGLAVRSHEIIEFLKKQGITANF